MSPSRVATSAGRGSMVGTSTWGLAVWVLAKVAGRTRAIRINVSGRVMRAPGVRYECSSGIRVDLGLFAEARLEQRPASVALKPKMHRAVESHPNLAKGARLGWGTRLFWFRSNRQRFRSNRQPLERSQVPADCSGSTC